MLVRIDVVERQPGRGECRELRRDLGRKLASNGGAQRDREAEPRHVGAEMTVRADEIGNAFGRQGGLRFDQHHVQTDAQARHRARAAHRVGRTRARDHQAGGRENTGPVRDLDRLVDLGREAEIVRGDDQAVQCAGALWARRKAKNSMPSRRRRFIICGLRIISPTIAAIFGTRK